MSYDKSRTYSAKMATIQRRNDRRRKVEMTITAPIPVIRNQVLSMKIAQ